MQSFTIMVDSSAIHYVSYTTDGRRLEVGFNHGQTYTYYGVPLQVAVDLATADSVGMYYNRAIKNQFAQEGSPPYRAPVKGIRSVGTQGAGRTLRRLAW